MFIFETVYMLFLWNRGHYHDIIQAQVNINSVSVVNTAEYRITEVILLNHLSDSHHGE